MQKKLIALAVAGLASTAAFAQTNVTIYGVVDAGYVYSSGDRNGAGNKNANYTGIDSGIWAGSRIGFKGEEGLGNGLKAVFTLEYYISPDENTGVGSAPQTTGAGGSGSVSRQTFVGLSHNKLGTVALGRQYAPGYFLAVRNDAFGGNAMSALATMNSAARNTIVPGTRARIDNSITYTSPNWSGFTVSAIYGAGENGGSTLDGISQGNDSVYGAALNYANGPLNLDLQYQTRQGVSSAIATTAGQVAHVSTQDSINEWAIGGSYDFKVVKLYATYQDQNDNNNTSTTELSNKVWSLGATMPVFGNGKIHAGYSRLSWDSKNSGDSSSWSLGYSHALSKRTTLYTAYNRTKNDDNVRVAAGPVGNTAVIDGASGTFVAGINHAF